MSKKYTTNGFQKIQIVQKALSKKKENKKKIQVKKVKLIKKMRLTSVLQAKRFNITDKIGELSKAFGNFPDSYVKRSSEQVYW